MKAVINKICRMVIPKANNCDLKLQVFPVSHENITLPNLCESWIRTVKDIFSSLPVQKDATTHYVTIDSKFFTTDGYQRREGVHIDGNFCADSGFGARTWGGMYINENGEVQKEFATETDISVPFGKYVSEKLGGILTISDYAGCEAWSGELPDCVGNEGSYLYDKIEEIKPVNLEPNELYFMTSNTPHRTLLIPKGIRRTLIRITLNHNYNNECLLHI